MSGSISQPMAMPQQGGGAAPQGLPPQLMAMLMAAAQRQQGGGPMQPQMGGPMQQQMGGPVQSPMPQMPPPQANGIPQVPGTADRGVAANYPGTADRGSIPLPMPGSYMGSATPSAPPPPSMPAMVGGLQGAQQVPMAAAQQPAMSRMMNQFGQMGRHGDTMMAHMTPGEIAVPPQVQTPGLLAALQQAFKGAGADVRQFSAGSPYAAHNPDTGQQEFSLWSALLPVAGAVVGSIVPGLGTGVGAALGGAAGGVAGGAIDHTGAAGMLLGGLGGAAGGYLGGGGSLGGLLGSGSGAAGAAGTGAASSLGDAGQSAMAARLAAGDSPAGLTAGTFGVNAPTVAASPIATGGVASPSFMQMAKTGMAAGMGAGIGQSLAPPPSSSSSPPGFNTPMGPVNPNLMIGGRPAVSAPTFSGYSPYASVTSPAGPYRFY